MLRVCNLSESFKFCQLSVDEVTDMAISALIRNGHGTDFITSQNCSVFHNFF